MKAKAFNIHKDIYTKAHGEHNAPWLLKAITWLQNIHNAYPTDILQLDLARFPLLLDEKDNVREDRKNPTSSYWSPNNPYPINSLTNDDAIFEFMSNPERTHIMIQTKEDITALVAEKNRKPRTTMLIATQYIASYNPTKALMGECKQRAVMIMIIVRIKKKELFISLK
jgi:hypothetical protein